ncbi:Ig-like domain-containing protein [Speluncibacter jeojiensis]|uniref:Ig-like domain-containing protein n=1 Tax=Speluncibacter jeojiensis TaxID=2710754 RepID=A0A9X4M134_9ACTN|nr:Ig-like domain-containing protein [Corynebacteriales bacterium D3-21]
MKPSLRALLAATAGTAVIAGPLALTTTATAGPSDVSFKASCIAGSIIGDQKRITDNTITIDAPAKVEPGQEFTFRLQPSATSYPDKDSGATTTNLSRLKIDYEIPDNATFVSAGVVPGTAVGLDNVAPNVLRVNDSGNVDANGTIIRLSGNNELIGNSPSSNAKAEGGIRVPKTKKNLDGTTNSAGETWFRLPAVEVTMKAGPSGTIQPKVRTSGAAATQGDMANFSTQLAKASLLGTQWAPTRCSPRDSDGGPLNAGAGPLATIAIESSDQATTTTLAAPQDATTGQEIQLSATVAPAPTGGKVQFKDNGAPLGGPVDLANGKATLPHTFTSAGDHSITAEFAGVAGFTGSASTATTVTVKDPAPVDKNTTTTVMVPGSAKTGTPVTLRATVTVAGATDPATTGTVQFQENGSPLGTPVNVTGGAAEIEHTFTTTGDHSITAVYSGGAGFTGSTSQAGTVSVTAPDPTDVATTIVLSAPSSATKGVAVDLTATLTPATVTGGTVQFLDGTTALGSPVAMTDGKAVLHQAFTATGDRKVTAVYSGAPGFKGSTSQAVTVTVAGGGTGGGGTGSLQNILGGFGSSK